MTAYAAFPRAHWRKIASTNPLERINKEIKRRSNVVGIFPDDASAIRLVGAVLLEQHDDWAVSERRYLSEESMALIDQPQEVTTTDARELPAALPPARRPRVTDLLPPPRGTRPQAETHASHSRRATRLRPRPVVGRR